MSKFLDAALKYAAKGINVVPLKPKSNIPFMKDWPNKATTDENQIRQWWGENQDYNVAIVTGQKNHLIVVDLDLDETKGKYGYELARDWQREHGNFPEDSWTAITPHSGYHLYFWNDQPQKSPQALFFENSGVDIRADAACVAAPPSVREDGRCYEWEQDPDEFELKPMNEAVWQFIKEGEAEKKKKTRENHKGNSEENHITFEMPDEILEGSRTGTLVALIGLLISKGLSEAAIRAAVEAENESRCNPPLSNQDLEREVFPALTRDWEASKPYIKSEVRKEAEKLSFIRADELIGKELEKIMFIVEGMIPVGLSIVASPPKFGKSWFVLDMCISVAGGTDFLGRHTQQCGVLYLALEDSENRLQERIGKILHGRKAPMGLAMSTKSADLGHGLIAQLTEFCENNPDTKLIVIDTFEKIRSEMKSRESVYSADYREAGEIKNFADQYKLAIVLVHHTRKSKDISDPFVNVSGTHGLTGAADTMIVLEKEKRSDELTKLSITGRDVIMDEFVLRFRDNRWQIEGTVPEVEKRFEEEDYNKNPIVKTIKKLIQDSEKGEWKGTASELQKSSFTFGTPIYESAQQIGKKVRDIKKMLYQNDNINFQVIKNGSGSARYKFSYEKNFIRRDS